MEKGTLVSKPHILQTPRSATHNPIGQSGDREGLTCACSIQTL